MTREDEGPTLRVELRPHAQAHLVRLPAKQHHVDRLHEGVHAIETFGSGAGRQPFEITVRPRDVTVRAGCDVDDDFSALRHEACLRWLTVQKRADPLRRVTTDVVVRRTLIDAAAGTVQGGDVQYRRPAAGASAPAPSAPTRVRLPRAYPGLDTP